VTERPGDDLARNNSIIDHRSQDLVEHVRGEVLEKHRVELGAGDFVMRPDWLPGEPSRRREEVSDVM